MPFSEKVKEFMGENVDYRTLGFRDSVNGGCVLLISYIFIAVVCFHVPPLWDEVFRIAIGLWAPGNHSDYEWFRDLMRGVLFVCWAVCIVIRGWFQFIP